jgi:hypothetical protein
VLLLVASAQRYQLLGVLQECLPGLQLLLLLPLRAQLVLLRL